MNANNNKQRKGMKFIIITSIIMIILVIGLRVFELYKYDDPINFLPHSSKAQAVDKITVNINSADLEQLCELPQIGKVLAQRIIDYREENGNFKTIDDIKLVKGIGENIYNRISSMIAV